MITQVLAIRLIVNQREVAESLSWHLSVLGLINLSSLGMLLCSYFCIHLFWSP